MNWNDIHWDIPLQARPAVWYTGVGNHLPGVLRYHYKDTWCLHLYRYEGELILDGDRFPIRPNYASVIPPDVNFEVRLHAPAVHVFALFRLPRVRRPNGDIVSIPAMQDLGVDFARLYGALEDGVRWSNEQPRRTDVRVWDVLWQLADRPRHTADHKAVSPPLQKALELIEIRLSERIFVSALAYEVGVSHNQLTKLFRAEFNVTVVEYIVRRRMQRAEQLLRHSTMPIKSIAAEVGIRDLQLFNKTVRRVFHASPRSLR